MQKLHTDSLRNSHNVRKQEKNTNDVRTIMVLAASALVVKINKLLENCACCRPLALTLFFASIDALKL
jgi:hypothetical protein